MWKLGCRVSAKWNEDWELLARNARVAFQEEIFACGNLKNYNCDCVVHQMLINKHVMLNLLKHLCAEDNISVATSCANTILSNIPSDSNQKYGLSEYELYFSWLSLTNHSFIQYDSATKYQRTPQKGIRCRELQPLMKIASDANVTYLVAEKVRN
jgi:hypothetical protein